MSYPALARVAAAAAVTLLMFQTAGCRAKSSHKHESREFVVLPGKFAEVNVRMVAKARVSARFDANAPLAWDTHSHPDGETKYYKKGNAASGTLSITADKRDVYSFLWKNDNKKSVKLRVELDLPRGTEVDSWVGHD